LDHRPLESHHYDDTLESIELITADAYEPMLPCRSSSTSTTKSPFRHPAAGSDVKQLITQTLDPLLSAFFRDVAHKKSMLQLIHDRDDIQAGSRGIAAKFRHFDIECVDVLIVRPTRRKQSGRHQDRKPLGTVAPCGSSPSASGNVQRQQDAAVQQNP
jgi:hypothetical protein